MSFWICSTCAVEHEERVAVCAICADERQWVPTSGQQWTTLDQLAAEGHRVVLEELEPDLFGLSDAGGVGIGQQAKVVRSPEGTVLWDPIGYLDDEGVAAVQALGPVRAVVASHPHMFGVQVEWSRRLGGVPVLVARADAHWVARQDPSIELWEGNREVMPGLTLRQLGGHFPGCAILDWSAGADGRGVLLVGDTTAPNPDRESVAFMRSFPNRIPLSAAVVQRLASAFAELEFDRIYGNFDNVIPQAGKLSVARSAERHIAWVRGDYDHLT
jgi:hypothetical protein